MPPAQDEEPNQVTEQKQEIIEVHQQVEYTEEVTEVVEVT
jgi:hypothetical protein